MKDLLASVLDAHGGVDRWAGVHALTARLSIGGPFWSRKGWPEIFGDQTTLELDARREHIVMTLFNGVGRRSVFDVDPERVVVHTDDGVAVERRDDPRASFAGYEVTTPWAALQVAYFISYACWNYLTAPFLFTYPGVQTRELEPFSSPSISTCRRTSAGSSSLLNVACIGAPQTGPPTRARPRLRSTSPTSQSTPTSIPHQRNRQHQRRFALRRSPRTRTTATDVPWTRCDRGLTCCGFPG
jgi:hypothetical protein